MASAASPQIDGERALERLRAADPPLFLSPSSDLSSTARSASRYIFSSLLPHCPKPPIESLLTDEDFDAEQIWSQIDLFSRPILSSIRRELRRLDRVEAVVNVVAEEDVAEEEDLEEEEEEIEEEEEEEGELETNGVEDRFLRIGELEDYLEDDEAREFGFERKGGRGEREEAEDGDEDEGDGEEEEEEGDEEDDEVKK